MFGGNRGSVANMNKDVEVSRAAISRRRALALGGTISLGGLLAACGVGDTTSAPEGSAAATATPTRAPSPAAASGAGAAATTGATSAAVVALLDQSPTCTMTPESTAGPFWFDVESIRTDIREDRPGATLQLAMRVNDVSTCSTDGGLGTPIPNCVVEIWHCDAGGVYSGFESSSAASRDDGTYLRGAQVTKADGVAQFTTIYPGWYPGRTVHIHLKVHVDRRNVLTGQLYFDEALNDAVNATPPYDEHAGRRTLNVDDRLFEESSVVTAVADGQGYLAAINLGVVPAGG